MQIFFSLFILLAISLNLRISQNYQFQIFSIPFTYFSFHQTFPILSIYKKIIKLW